VARRVAASGFRFTAAPVLAAPPVPPNTLQWLALAHTEGARPGAFEASWSNTSEALQARHLPSLKRRDCGLASAQSIFTGKSLDLAKQEMVKLADSKADIVALDDPRYPIAERRSTTHRWFRMCAGR
jgi:predicted Rossmann fold nucleotide-binding protein DprA/Smf involved in DNA uptake